MMEIKLLECKHDECKHYWDEGDKLRDYYCPSGFRFLTNTDYICLDGSASQYAIDLIQKCWKFYDSVAVGPAFGCNGFIMQNMISIYLKKADSVSDISVRFGNKCDFCGEYYEDKDIVHSETYFRRVTKICKNCFNVYSYEEIKVGNSVVLVCMIRY